MSNSEDTQRFFRRLLRKAGSITDLLCSETRTGYRPPDQIDIDLTGPTPLGRIRWISPSDPKLVYTIVVTEIEPNLEVTQITHTCYLGGKLLTARASNGDSILPENTIVSSYDTNVGTHLYEYFYLNKKVDECLPEKV